MSVKKIAVIGAGQIGSRHLQALARLELPVEVEVYDPNIESLKLAKKRLAEVINPHRELKVKYLSRFEELSKEINLAIIATCADIRAVITVQLINHSRIENIIFEKILFQSLVDYEKIGQSLRAKNISAWVNCVRRTYPIYRQVKSLLGDKSNNIVFHLLGGEWGLTCNAIHFLDLLAFLTGSLTVEIDASGLDSDPIPSKRAGFYESTGTLRGRFVGGSEFFLTALRGSSTPHLISITSDKVIVVIDENHGCARLAYKKGNWNWQNIHFSIPYQSEWTDKLVSSILEGQKPGLPSYEESAVIHIAFLRALLDRYGHLGGWGKVCPIT
uniref:Gfo/Idh/MocA-like oxidoreductase N-terminal domain-containing protein n=1 Tax=candidate division CPR3 bacterium TaxID=2268181 RepID=A0A7V3J922_UNCC3